MLVAYSLKLVLVFVLYVHMWMFNRARDQAAEASRAGPSGVIDEKETIELGMHDVTEIDNKGFRYTL